MPAHVRAPKSAWKQAVEIECYGLGTECLGGVLIDDSFWLEGMEASSSFFLLPVKRNCTVPYARATFIADCLSFEHEIPVVALPLQSRLRPADLPWFHTSWGIPGVSAKQKPRDAIARYYEALREAFEVSQRLTNGLFCNVVFKHDWAELPKGSVSDQFTVRVSYSAPYAHVSTALHLYNAALRQPDPLFHYLGFYRVIENCAQDNGKAWIESAIATRRLDYRDPIWCEFPPGIRSLTPRLMQKLRRMQLRNKRGRVNSLEIMRAQAFVRIEDLLATTTPADVARRLYSANRCGIAHGKNAIRRHDLADDFVEVLRDIPLIRYLARIAIEESL